MEKAPIIRAQNFELGPKTMASIRRRIARLERFAPRLIGCSVIIEGPGKHHKGSGLYSVRLDLRVPGGEPIAVSRQEDGDFRVATREAFSAATRRLEDFVRRRRGDVKRHTLPSADGLPTVLEA